MDIISIILRAFSGIASLLYGKRIFWVFVMLVGFMAGFILGGLVLPEATVLVKVLIGIGMGVVGAILSRFFPNAIAAVIGFLAVGGILMNQLAALTPLGAVLKTVIFIVGGVAGVYLAVKFFDLALVIVSSFTGAGTLAALGSELLKYSGTIQTLIFVILLVVGIVFQLKAVKPHDSDKVIPAV